MRYYRTLKAASDVRAGDYLETTIGDRTMAEEVTAVLPPVQLESLGDVPFGGRVYKGETMVRLVICDETVLMTDANDMLPIQRAKGVM